MRHATMLRFLVILVTVVMSLVASVGVASGRGSDDGRGITPLIVGGEPVDISEVPWQVSILQAHLDPSADDGFLDQFCGGAVLAATWVVTAAHCVFQELGDGEYEKLRPVDVEVAAGYAELGAIPSTARHGVVRIIVPDGYDPTGFDVDIALLELSTALPLADGTIEAIDVFDEAVLGSGPASGASVRVSGWGCTVLLSPGDACPGDSFANELRAVDLQVINDPDASTCGAVSGVNAATMICAGRADLSDGKDFCVGDSG